MKIGLCLTGGGAKGAFEVGVIDCMRDNNIIPEIVTGTSIGAINAYYLMNNSCEELIELWEKVEQEQNLDLIALCNRGSKVIDNDYIIDKAKKINEKDTLIKKVYVNYVEVEEGQLKHKIINIMEETKENRINSIKYSSLLPMNSSLLVLDEVTKEAFIKYNSELLFEQFKLDVQNGVYNGFKLDGGILNNSLLEPFIFENKVDKLIIIALKNNYRIPEYILPHYQNEDIIVLEPDMQIRPEDTLNFTKDFCKDMIARGYKAFANIISKVKE